MRYIQYCSLRYDTLSLTYETSIGQGLLLSLSFRNIYSDVIIAEWKGKLRETFKLRNQILNTA